MIEIEAKMKAAGITGNTTHEEAYDKIGALFRDDSERDIAADIYEGMRFEEEFHAALERGEV